MPPRSEDLSAIGRAIREIRTTRGISQEQLSLDAGVDRAFVSALERGQRNVTLGNLLKVCRALDVKPSDVFRRWEKHVGWKTSGNSVPNTD
jgi:transcriptional regulator with XRE-family HTH domain